MHTRSVQRGARVFLVVLVATVSASARDGTAPPASGRVSEFLRSSGYIAALRAGDAITSLRFDADGEGRYGPETIAPGGCLRGFATMELRGDTLLLEGANGEWTWDLPFERAGYYDADRHVHYPTPTSTGGARPLAMPFRRFVTSAGQYVNIEHFKRLPVGPCLHALNIADGSQLRLAGDAGQNGDVTLTCPGSDTVPCEVAEHALRLKIRWNGQPCMIRVRPRGTEPVPGSRIVHPSVRFEPDFPVTFEPTGKSVSASELMTDLLRMGTYWHPSMIVLGDWGLGAVETHLLDDPRSWYLRRLRGELLREIADIGYDRFEHFGMMFAWGRYPDYGAGGLLNVPPGNAPYDMRMLHLNGQWIVTIARYVLATGDTDLLRSRRARWLATDADSSRPICGAKAACTDFVLAAGDMRLDGRTSEKAHTLSQSFRADRPFGKILLRLGTESRTEAAKGWMQLRRAPGGAVLTRLPFRLEPGRDAALEFAFPQQPAGDYCVEIGDDDSGRRYFGPGIYWWTDPDSDEPAPPAGSGPFAGTLYDRLVLLFDYLRAHTCAGREDLFCYLNDPRYNVPDYKSGRPRVCTQNSYWEAAGGGYDAFEGLWYNAACRAMADMAQRLRDDAAAARYRELAARADRAYNARYWHTPRDNGRPFPRYHACEDWDGRTHDYGFAYYNLEAAARGIPTNDQARAILWWLDRGQWSPDGGRQWRDHIYDLWGFAPPFNTIANEAWINVTGTLPYREVLTNGGTRPTIAGRDLLVRSRYVGIDNVHERNCRILSRFASPDRFTGGRTFDDPGGRGRWHFGPPDIDRADVEGFREIFPQNGDMVTCQVMSYLGMDYSADGLWLRPRVPSDMDRMVFEGIGYAGALFQFDARALRSDAPTVAVARDDLWTFGFQAGEPFCKAGLRVRVRPSPVGHNHRLSLTLERQDDRDWRVVARTWYSHVRDGQWVWLRAEEWLPPGEYRLRVSEIEKPTGQLMEPMEPAKGSPVRCVAERTHLIVEKADRPGSSSFRLEGGSAVTPSRWEATLEPGRRARLMRD